EASSLGVSAHCAPHLHAHVGAAAPNLRHVEWFHDHARIETWLFHGALDPSGGYLRPGVSGRPGHGLTLREDVAVPFRVRWQSSLVAAGIGPGKTKVEPQATAPERNDHM